MIQRLLLLWLWFGLGLAFIPSLLASGNLIEQDSFRLELDNCDATAPLCISVPFSDFMSYRVLQNGADFTGVKTPCNFELQQNFSFATLFNENNTGTFSLTSWTIDGQIFINDFDNLNQLVELMNIWDPTGNWRLEDMTIIGGNGMSTYGTMMITRPDGSMAQIAPSSSDTPQGTMLTLTKGNYDFILIDMVNMCTDTFNVFVTCTTISDDYEGTIPVDGGAITLCLDTTELTGAVDTIFNACPEQGGAFTDLVFDEVNNCVKIRANKAGGIDTTCVVICDEFNICDTVTVIITTVDSTQYVSDIVDITIPINTSDTYCVSTMELRGNPINMENICPLLSGDNVDITFDSENFCISYTGFAIGSDTICVVITDDLGGQDTTSIYVTVVPPMTEVIQDTIAVDQSDIYCLDTSELAGDLGEISNICSASSGMFVNFELNNVSLCIEFTGTSIGVDTACLVLCDDFGTCDTTTLVVTVLESGFNNPPIAVDDTANIPLNTTTAIDILGNDIIPNNVLTAEYILPIDMGGVGPQNGIALIAQDGTLSYTPNVNYCGEDSLSYVICNSNGCDTAIVAFNIDCFAIDPGDYIIYTGISPNGDGLNDAFTIKGIENLPDHEIIIYNRWSNIVFTTKNYRNSWRATYQGKPLPDGVYFYIFRPTPTEQVSGWLQVNR